MLTANDKLTTTPSILRCRGKSYLNMYINNARKCIPQIYSPHGKSFQTDINPLLPDIVTVAKILKSINCSKLVNTNHPMKLKHFHMFFAKCTHLNTVELRWWFELKRTVKMCSRYRKFEPSKFRMLHIIY